MSLPSEPKQSPAAVATPEPLDDTPGQYSAPQGFTGGVTSGWCQPYAPSVSCVLPRITAPAPASPSTTAAV